MLKRFPPQAMWYDTWTALLDFHRESDGAAGPPPDPFPPEAWPFASDEMKTRRWEATITWARVHGVEDLLIGAED